MLILLVRNTVSHLTSEHHLVTSHIIIHNIFQVWHVGHFVNQVKVDEIVGRYLYPDISFDKIDEPSHSDLMILGPFHLFCVRVFHLLEEKDATGATADECFTVE